MIHSQTKIPVTAQGYTFTSDAAQHMYNMSGLVSSSNICNISLVVGSGVRITDISHTILGYISGTVHQYARLEISNDMCTQVAGHTHALITIYFSPLLNNSIQIEDSLN